jgi:glutamyl-tRNA reductase
VERALRARRRRPMFMVDLAVPRDIEPEAAELDDVFLYTVDDLAQIVSENRSARRSAVEQAEAIIETQVGQFMHWMQARESVPLIRALRDQAEGARRQELERALKALKRGEEPQQVLESLSQGLTNKLMHAPTQALNEATGEERRTLGETLARLFRIRP